MAAFKRKGFFPNKQNYPTPKDLLIAVQKQHGAIALDCAADKINHVVSKWLGPGGMHADALACSWGTGSGLRWLNPPFERIAPWARKCVQESCTSNLRIAMLVPATVSHNWFWELVKPYAWTRILYPQKVSFEGMKNDLPQGFMLCLYGMGNVGLIDRWCWKRVTKQGVAFQSPIFT